MKILPYIILALFVQTTLSRADQEKPMVVEITTTDEKGAAQISTAPFLAGSPCTVPINLNYRGLGICTVNIITEDSTGNEIDPNLVQFDLAQSSDGRPIFSTKQILTLGKAVQLLQSPGLSVTAKISPAGDAK